MNADNYPYIRGTITSFIREKMNGSGTSGAVIGLSGGIDSTLTAYLAVEALGSQNVLGILMPEKKITTSRDIEDAMEIVRILEIDHKAIEISDILRSFSSMIPNYDEHQISVTGNLKARIRMCILYYHANLMHRMVIGTGNKTELLLGYFTKYGDGGVDIEPIGGLYKTDVRGLSRYMGIPGRIIDKTPTAGLWPGQTDEGELGLSYGTADRILKMLVDEKQDESAARKLFSQDQVDKITSRMRANYHKRETPQICEIITLI